MRKRFTERLGSVELVRDKAGWRARFPEISRPPAADDAPALNASCCGKDDPAGEAFKPRGRERLRAYVVGRFPDMNAGEKRREGGGGEKQA